MKKELNHLFNFVSSRSLKYEQDNKNQFKKIGLSTMRKFAKQLKLREFEAHFNQGGIAVSGDLQLTGMFNDNVGIYIQISQGVFNTNFECMYRTIKNMKDYSGGSNNWAKDKDLFLRLPELVYQICKINPADLVGVKSNNLVKAATTIKQKVGKYKQEDYDKIYEAYQNHFQYGNYFRVDANSEDRIHDLTMATLAYKKHVFNPETGGSKIENPENFLFIKFTFTGGKGNISTLLNSYRGEIWGIFNQFSGRYEVEDLWQYEDFEEVEEEN